MKKNEVISKLIDFHEETFPSVGRGMSQKEYFSELLDLLVGEGMLPPHDGKGKILFEDVQYIIDHYKWEL